MAKNPLELAIGDAVRSNERIGELFARIGTSEHPRGLILRAYRNARRAMRSALAEEYPMMAVREVLDGLRLDIRAAASEILSEASELGMESAYRQAGFYLPAGDIVQRRQETGLAIQAAIGAILAKVESQAATVEAITASDGDGALIVGDEERVGVLRPGDAAGAAAFWAANAAWNGWSGVVEGLFEEREQRFKKMACAALDARTTDCCLQVNGQVRNLKEDFHLTGEPRYADRLDGPPFHWYCRTSTTLYLAEFDDGLSERMAQSADYVLGLKRRGVEWDQHPADAFAIIEK